MIEFDAAMAAFIASSLRSASPLLLVLLGECLSQRTGVINLGIEGEMLMGAVIGFIVAAETGNPWVGIGAGAVAGMALSFVHSALCLGCRANQIGSGLAVMLLGIGLSTYIGRPYVGSAIDGLGSVDPGLFGVIPILGDVLGRITPTVVLAVALVPIVAIFLARTRTGLIWRAVGESTEIVTALGFNATRTRFVAISVGGILAGIGGAALSVDYTLTWAQEMTKGRGLIAVGLVIIARWRPSLTLPAALLFGGFEALGLRIQAGGSNISPYLLSMMPYLASLIVVAIAYRAAISGGGMPMALREVFRQAQ